MKHHLPAIHLAVLLFGAAGLFGKVTSLGSDVIVFGRSLFAMLALLALYQIRRQSLLIENRKHWLQLLALGPLLAFHWVTFFYSIEISTVAIGLISFSTFPLFVTFIEPWLFKQSLRRKDILLSAITLVGIYLVIPEFRLANQATLGVIIGILSAASFALLTTLNKKFSHDYPSATIAFWQNLVAAICLLPWIGNQLGNLQAHDWLALVILGVVFTATAHSLFIYGMKQVRAQLASLIVCLEPVYAILLAIVLLGEIPSLQQAIGGTVIILVIVAGSWKGKTAEV